MNGWLRRTWILPALWLMTIAARADEPGGGPKGPSVPHGVKAPPGVRVTMFGAPPEVHYPTCLAVSASGEVFVGVDENGSLDAKAGRGRVLRCVDLDDDGTADRINVFAQMDSPRGLVYDAGTLYVLHPP